MCDGSALLGNTRGVNKNAILKGSDLSPAVERMPRSNSCTEGLELNRFAHVH